MKTWEFIAAWRGVMVGKGKTVKDEAKEISVNINGNEERKREQELQWIYWVQTEVVGQVLLLVFFFFFFLVKKKGEKEKRGGGGRGGVGVGVVEQVFRGRVGGCFHKERVIVKMTY